MSESTQILTQFASRTTEATLAILCLPNFIFSSVYLRSISFCRSLHFYFRHLSARSLSIKVSLPRYVHFQDGLQGRIPLENQPRRLPSRRECEKHKASLLSHSHHLSLMFQYRISWNNQWNKRGAEQRARKMGRKRRWLSINRPKCWRTSS